MEAKSATGEEIQFERTEFTDLSTGLPVCVLTVTAPGRSSSVQLLGACLVSTLAVTTCLLPTGSILLIVLASVGVFVILLLVLLCAQQPFKETVVVARDVGVHVKKERLGGITQTHFIPYSYIHDIIIHEAITMHRVIFYIALLLHTSNEDHTNTVPISELVSMPLFEDFKPQLSTLRETYDSIRRTLHMN